jgi:hypothetical protein
MDGDRFTCAEGCKQIQLDGHHFADCVSPEAAKVATICLNRAGLADYKWPPAERKLALEFFA